MQTTARGDGSIAIVASPRWYSWASASVSSAPTVGRGNGGGAFGRVTAEVARGSPAAAAVDPVGDSVGLRGPGFDLGVIARPKSAHSEGDRGFVQNGTE